jgi:hypothetical protein
MERLKGLIVSSIYFAEWGTFGPSTHSATYYIRGFATVYSNGMISVVGGGGASGMDSITMWLLQPKDTQLLIFDENASPEWELLDTWEEIR